MSEVLSGKIREKTGKVATKEVRKNGEIPAVLYGLKDNLSFSVSPSNLKDILTNEKQWTRNSPLISSQNICIYVVDKYKDIFTNISIPIKELYWY